MSQYLISRDPTFSTSFWVCNILAFMLSFTFKVNKPFFSFSIHNNNSSFFGAWSLNHLRVLYFALYWGFYIWSRYNDGWLMRDEWKGQWKVWKSWGQGTIRNTRPLLGFTSNLAKIHNCSYFWYKSPNREHNIIRADGSDFKLQKNCYCYYVCKRKKMVCLPS